MSKGSKIFLYNLYLLPLKLVTTFAMLKIVTFIYIYIYIFFLSSHSWDWNSLRVAQVTAAYSFHWETVPANDGSGKTPIVSKHGA